ncbi:MAG: hypothetical protein ACREPR_25145, partial [Brasilonema sp.]
MIRKIATRSALAFGNPKGERSSASPDRRSRTAGIGGATQTRSPLVDYSKFLLSKRHKLFTEPSLGWDNWDTHNQDYDLQSIEIEPLNFIAEENSKDHVLEQVEDSTKDNLTLINTHNTNSKNEPTLQEKSKLKEQKTIPAKSKTKSKSKNKQLVQSLVNNKINQGFDESHAGMHLNQDTLLAADEAFDAESLTPIFNNNSPSLQQDDVAQVLQSIVRLRNAQTPKGVSPHDNITFDNSTAHQSPQHSADSPTSRIAEGKKPQTSSPPLFSTSTPSASEQTTSSPETRQLFPTATPEASEQTTSSPETRQL